MHHSILEGIVYFFRNGWIVYIVHLILFAIAEKETVESKQPRHYTETKEKKITIIEKKKPIVENNYSEWVCSNCGTKNSAISLYCKNCKEFK